LFKRGDFIIHSRIGQAIDFGYFSSFER